MHGNNVRKVDKKRFISLILLFLFSVSISSGIAFAISDSNSIPSMDIDLYFKSDGSLHVKKTVHYSLSGDNDIYRDFDIEREQNLENLKVSFQGAYVDYHIYDNRPSSSITMLFFSDPEKTIRAGKKDVNVIIEYDLLQAINFYNDTAYLQYKLVDDSWYKNVGKVNANIHLKSSNNVKYWLNTSTNTKNSSWNGNNLKITAQHIMEGNYLEVNMLIPKDQFDANPKNGYVINKGLLSEIEKNETNYKIQQDLQKSINNISPLLALLISFTPLFIYSRYGREPKINYDAKYEMDLPTDDPPAIVNAVCAGDPKRIGVPNLDGFRATIMDLIDRNYLLLNDMPYGEDYDTSGSLFLEINPDYNSDNLWEFEVQVLNFLKEYEQDGIISMDLISDSLGYVNSSRFFKATYRNWRKEVKKTLLAEDSFKESFYSKGDNYLKIFGFVGVLTAFVFFRVVPTNSFSSIFILCTLILGAVSVISLILPQRIAGQWTPYGKEYYEKWKGFKRYIEDYSLIKSYSPESVKIWNKYLVYATAFGAADGVRKAMDLSFPKDQLERSNVYLYYNTAEIRRSFLDGDTDSTSDSE